MKMENSALEVLRLVHKCGHPEAIIAGGAPRDTYHNQMVRDYDIFLNMKATNGMTHTMAHWEKVLGLHRGKYAFDDHVRFTQSSYQQANDLGPRIIRIFDVVKNYTPFQLIFVDVPPVEFVENYFDIGLCKCYVERATHITGKERSLRIHYSNDFLQDSLNKTLTICGRDMTKAQFEYTMKNHLPRIQYKYPTHSVRVAPHLQHLKEWYDNR